jgi:polysaccharide biosynthesis/export protein
MKMTCKHSGRKLLFVLITIMMFSCVSQKKITLVQEKTEKEMKTHFVNPKATTYRIQVGDNLYIRVNSIDPKTSKFFQTDFPYLMNNTYQYLNTYVVDEFGYINFSFIEKMSVAGLTVPEIQSNIQKKLDEYFKDATVFVKLVNFQVGILGEVNSPGNYTIEQEQINIYQALGLAGGITSYGKLTATKLIRQVQGGSEVYLVDLTDNRIMESPYFYLMPNDVLYIEPRGSKSWTLEKFPYQHIMYLISLSVLGYSLFNK